MMQQKPSFIRDRLCNVPVEVPLRSIDAPALRFEASPAHSRGRLASPGTQLSLTHGSTAGA